MISIKETVLTNYNIFDILTTVFELAIFIEMLIKLKISTELQKDKKI